LQLVNRNIITDDTFVGVTSGKKLFYQKAIELKDEICVPVVQGVRNNIFMGKKFRD
jgi:hypothetical protein